MSFLSGLKSAYNFITGKSILSGLARTAILGYAVNKLSSNALKDNAAGTQNIDKGVRLQVKPDASARIPVLYGSAFFGGNISDAAMTNNNKTMWYCLVLSEKTGNLYSSSSASSYTLNNVYWNNQRLIFDSDGITVDYAVDRDGNIDRSLEGQVKVYFYAGSSTSQQAPSGYSITAANAYSLFPNWSAGTHAMSNLVFALVRVDYNREKNVTGLGNMLFQVTNSMKQPGDVIYDYLTNARYGAGISASTVLTSDITALNSYSLDNINYDDQGTGAETLADRYQINGLIDTANPVLENAEAILSAAGSWLSYDAHAGEWGIVINKTESSVASFDDSNILDSISLSGTGLKDLYNAVKVEFPHRELRDSADFYNIELNKRNANEETNFLNLTYDIINEPIQAQMLALIELKQSRLDRVIQFKTDFSYYNLKAGDVIDVTNDRFSFTNEEFRIISIEEVQDDDGALLMMITALQYDDTIYTFDDLYRYTRSDEDGIVTIGSIGTPGTPTVTKYERDSRPRIEITTTSPTGVVEGMEFWLTTDVLVGDDANRSYTLIGIKRPDGGGVYASGTSVTLEYTTNTSNFYVKTRGFNSSTVGPFSNISGLVEFEATQITDGITADTGIFDGTGGLLTALAITELLQGVDGLFAGDEGGLFSKIFETFEDVTGIDLLGDASDGSLVVTSDLTIQDDDVDVITGISKLNFKGVTVGVDGTIVTIDHTDGGGDGEHPTIDITADETTISGPTTVTFTLSQPSNDFDSSDIEATGGTISNFVAVSETVYTATFTPSDGEPEGSSGTVTVDPATFTNEYGVGNITGDSISFTINYDLRIITKYPPDRTTQREPVSETTYATQTGSYWLRFGRNNADPLSSFYKDLTTGIGNVYLYKSDGTLVETLTEGDIIISGGWVELPFADRDTGTDYYILIDAGLVEYCGFESIGITDPLTWNFNTAPYSSTETYGDPPSINSGTVDPNTVIFYATAYSPSGNDNCATTVELEITFNISSIKIGTGNILIYDVDDDSVVDTIDASTGIVDGATINYGEISNVEWGKSYYITSTAGIAIYDCDLESDEIEASDNFTFSIQNPLELVSFTINSNPLATNDKTQANIQTNIVLNFNKQVSMGDSGSISLYKLDGTLHQTFTVNDTFENENVSELFWSSGNSVTLNPTVDLAIGTTYYVTATPLSVKTATDCPETWDGLSDTSVVRFTTDDGPTSTIAVGSDTGVINQEGIEMTFDRTVVPGSGNIVIKNSLGGTVATIPANSPAITIQEV